MSKETTYHSIKPQKGIIIVNFGSPETLTKKGIRKFLWRLLTDRRVVELPRLIWWPILSRVSPNSEKTLVTLAIEPSAISIIMWILQKI